MYDPSENLECYRGRRGICDHHYEWNGGRIVEDSKLEDGDRATTSTASDSLFEIDEHSIPLAEATEEVPRHGSTFALPI